LDLRLELMFFNDHRPTLDNDLLKTLDAKRAIKTTYVVYSHQQEYDGIHSALLILLQYSQK